MLAVNNLNKIRSLLIERQLARDESKDAEIGTLLSGVFDELASLDYETGKDIRARLFTINDEFHDLFFAHLFFALQKQLAAARSLPMVRGPSKLSGGMDREVVSEFLFKLMHAYVPLGAGIRLSSVEIPDTAVPQEYREPLLLLIADMAQFDASYFEWERVDIGSTVISMSVGRQIARMSDRIDIFYAVLGVVIERLNAAQEYQLSRDVGEEVLVTSILDAKPEWGYHTLFMAFNGQFSINMALIYANACVATLRRKGNLPDLLFKRFLFSLHRFYRNIKFFKEAESLYEYMRGSLSLDPSDLFNVTSTHFSTKIFEKDPSVISDVYEYVTNNREFIFNSGKSVALPMLSILHNLKLMFASNPSIAMLDDYVPILEAIVGRDDSERLRALTYADSERLKQIFIEMLSNLRRTRSADDMVSEVRQALIVADKMINFSFYKQDIDAFLLAMVLKADYSLVFQDDFSDVERGFVALNSRQHDRQTDFADYDRYADQVRAAMRLEGKDRCLWLAESEKQVFSLELSKDGYSSIRKVAAWTTNAMYDWLSQGLGALAFEETKVTRGQVEQYLEEDQFQDLDKVKSAVKFTTVDMMNSSDNLLLVKDMEISAMPHNLILGASNEFISRENLITCLPSYLCYMEHGKRGFN